MDKKILQSTIDSVRVLSAEMIERAKSGHPGTPLGAAPLIAELYLNHLVHDPACPDFFNRDRFILSIGHASAMLYSICYLSGYDITEEDLKSFRQLGSKLPGHPEYGVTPGVETSTGPLGQGMANAIGFALAEKILAAKFNKPGYDISSHYTYVLCGDGCMMEGITSEAASLAAAWGLDKIIAIYDKNDITIEGGIDGVFEEDVAARYRASGWQVIDVADVNDTDAFAAALAAARADTAHPSLIIVRSVIGYGCDKANNCSCHGAPLGESCLCSLKSFLNWEQPPFKAHKDAEEYKKAVMARGKRLRLDWEKTLEGYKADYPEQYAEYQSWLNGNRLDLRADEDFWAAAPTKDDSTRSHSGRVLNYIAGRLENLIGGSADLGPSNMSIMTERGYFDKNNQTGTNLHFGVREAAMAAVINGLQLHGGFNAYCATFFVFSDYLKGSLRMSALMNIPTLYIFSHDSIGVGEDGPTHQPIEHLIMLRSVPNVRVWRPCDGLETAAAYASHFAGTHPTALITSRQKLVSPEGTSREGALKGGYVISDSTKETPDVLLIGTGSEVSLLVEAKKLLAEKSIDARIISMPCMELFEEQDENYKQSVLPNNVRARVAVEAGSKYSWGGYIGLDGECITKDSFGVSAPAGVLFKLFGFTAERVAEAAERSVMRAKK